MLAMPSSTAHLQTPVPNVEDVEPNLREPADDPHEYSQATTDLEVDAVPPLRAWLRQVGLVDALQPLVEAVRALSVTQRALSVTQPSSSRHPASS